MYPDLMSFLGDDLVRLKMALQVHTLIDSVVACPAKFHIDSFGGTAERG